METTDILVAAEKLAASVELARKNAEADRALRLKDAEAARQYNRVEDERRYRQHVALEFVKLAHKDGSSLTDTIALVDKFLDKLNGVEQETA